MAPATATTGVPVAYLKWILYDHQGTPVAEGSKIKPVTAVALTSWEELRLDFAMPQDGQLQVLVANESQRDVWFDDIEIKHTQDLIVQENHYDPWGLELAGIQKAGAPDDKWKFQGKEQIDDVGVNWSDFSARYYDPQLGRWHAVDPADQFATPYSAMANNPVIHTDPDGRIVPLIIAGAMIGYMAGTIKANQSGAKTEGAIIWAGFKGAAVGAASSALGGLAPIGILPGMAYGAASGALIGATDAAINGGNIGRSALRGAIAGAITGGAMGGIEAVQLHANIWTGYRQPHYYPVSADGALESFFKEDRLSYGDESLKKFKQSNFKDVEGVNNLTIKAHPKGLTRLPDGSLVKADGEKVYAATLPRVWKHGRTASVFFSKQAFYSPEVMFEVMGHELGHVQHIVAGVNETFSEADRHLAIYQWERDAANANGWKGYANYVQDTHIIFRQPEPALRIDIPTKLLIRHP